MNREWMYTADRRSDVFNKGLREFLNVAEREKPPSGFMCCPCKDCKNQKEYSKSANLHIHLLKKGFMPNYVLWTKHGERGVIQEENEEEEGDDSIPDFSQYGTFAGSTMDEDEEEVFAEDDHPDDLGQMLEEEVRDFSGNDREFMKFQRMLQDYKTLLYPDCKEGHNKLRSTLDMLQWKAANGVSDKGFGELLKLVKKFLPEGNVLPETTYEAKQVVCPLGLEIEKIHACPNDCILYRGEAYEKLDACPVCEASRYKIKKDDPGDVEGAPPRKRVPAKVMWYFPIIPRLKRLFRNKEHAKMMRWHKEERKEDGMLRHPADGSQWRKIDRTYKDFSDDPRSIRFGLSTDGMNPFGDMSSSHSTWPVTMCMFNLPPWLCLKRKFIMMPVLIQGPKQPGNDIDVYLRPLIEDLVKLWKDGVPMWDAHEQVEFNLRALLFVTINDWPALGNLSGQSNKGYKACTHCLDETDSTYLKHCRKVVYMGHRRFLVPNHQLRRKSKHFGAADHRSKPIHRDGKYRFSVVKDLRVVFGKGPGSQPVPNEDGRAPMWKKKSIFWDLPYWEDLDVHNAIDVMHLTKNLCVNILGFLGTYGKSKDTLQARQDLEHMEQRAGLHPEKREKGQHYLRPASYTLSKKERNSMFECFSNIKVPSGYSSNIKRLINMKEKKFVGLKSHDCHVMMTQLLPVALRGILPDNVRRTITKLCAFFNAISQKVIDPLNLERLQNDVVQCIVSLELIFPPSFFDIMTHLPVHIVKEISILGPVFLHSMFPFERFMAVLKKYVRNRSRPEGCIAKGYGTEEVIEFCVDYVDDLKPIGVPESRHEGRLLGKGTLGKKAIMNADYSTFSKAHSTVLHQSTHVAPYINEHKDILYSTYPGKSEAWIIRRHNDTFDAWLRQHLMDDETIHEQLAWLARGPSCSVLTFQGYEINGYTFYTIDQDKKSTNQNSGVRIDAIDNSGHKNTYYGYIEEIWELDYGPLKIPLFRCKWVKLTAGGVSIDQYGMTTVDLEKTAYKDEPFVLANDVTQVFYVKDMTSNRHIVLPGKRKIVGVENVVDEEDYNQFDDMPPFGVDADTSILLDNEEAPYIRRDHDEGTVVKKKFVTVTLDKEV